MKTLKDCKKIMLAAFLALFGLLAVVAQRPAPSTFKHVATASNSTNNYTVIDNPATNNHPGSILFISHDYGDRGLYITSPIGVWYSNNKWIIFNQDRSAMRTGAKFNVLTQTAADARVFIHTAASGTITRHITVVNNAATNNRPNAKLIVTQNWGTTGPYNKNPIGVYYEGGEWKIYN